MKNQLFEFDYLNRKECGDATAIYNVILKRKCTVKEFIDSVLSTGQEWGYIGIKSKKEPFFGYPVCEYSYGKLTTEPIPEEFLTRIVKKVKASGGYSRMDYLLELRRK